MAPSPVQTVSQTAEGNRSQPCAKESKSQLRFQTQTPESIEALKERQLCSCDSVGSEAAAVTAISSNYNYGPRTWQAEKVQHARKTETMLQTETICIDWQEGWLHLPSPCVYSRIVGFSPELIRAIRSHWCPTQSAFDAVTNGARQQTREQHSK